MIKPGASLYVCHPSSWQREFQGALEAAGFAVRTAEGAGPPTILLAGPVLPMQTLRRHESDGMRPPIWRRRIQSIRYAMISADFSPNWRKQSTVRRVQAANDLEPVERVHFCVQGTRPDPTVQGDSKTGGLHRGTAGPWLLVGCGGTNGLNEREACIPSIFPALRPWPSCRPGARRSGCAGGERFTLHTAPLRTKTRRDGRKSIGPELSGRPGVSEW